MKMIDFIKGMALMCAVSLAACSDSDEIPQDNSSAVNNEVEQVGDSEYIVTVGAGVSVDGSRAIENNNFTAVYDPNVLYVHSNTNKEKKVLTFPLSDANEYGNKSFSFRLRLNDDGSFALSSQVENPIGTGSENSYEEYGADDKVYFSSWATSVWENKVQEDNVQVGKNTYIPVMYLQDRTSMGNWREIYRSAAHDEASKDNYTGQDLLQLGNAGGYGRVYMGRVVSGYMNAVIFTELLDKATSADVDDAGWRDIITDPRGDSPEDWTIRLYLGKFPTTYNFDDNTNGAETAYYASNKGEAQVFVEAGYSTQTGITGTTGAYNGFGLRTTFEYLCTPVAEVEDAEPLEAYIVVNNVNMEGENIVAHINQFGEDNQTGTLGYCYAIPNQIEQLITIFDLRDLAEMFGLEYVKEDGTKVEATSTASLKSRASGETKFVELKPRKVIRKTIY